MNTIKITYEVPDELPTGRYARVDLDAMVRAAVVGYEDDYDIDAIVRDVYEPWCYVDDQGRQVGETWYEQSVTDEEFWEIAKRHEIRHRDAVMVHPYYVAKAAEAMLKAGGDMAASGPLAAWAEAHKADDRAGVLVAFDGTILATTERLYERGTGTQSYWVVDADAERWELDGSHCRVSEAVSALARQTGQPVIHLRSWEVCRGHSGFIPAEARAYADAQVSSPPPAAGPDGD